jgi:carbonic anhydrase
MKNDEIIKDLQSQNIKYVSGKADVISRHIASQNPDILVLTCSDSRVVPEYIFKKDIGEFFTIRVAGNIAKDSSVISSIEYAISNFDIELIIILGHTNCGAIAAAEKSDTGGELLQEIKESFKIDSNHALANLKRQLEYLPKRSKIVEDAIKSNKLDLVGAIYHLENGIVEFL